MLDVITIGDATLDTFIDCESSSHAVSVDQKTNKLCFELGEKIGIKSLHKKVAGNAANVAVGVSRLGMSSGFWTILGDDAFSKEVVKKMKDEKVSTKYVQFQKNSESNYTVVLNFSGERTQLTYRLPRVYDLPNNLEKSKFVYLTAMGENHQMAYGELLKYLVTKHALLAYNPGGYQITCKEKICNDLLPFTNILFVNVEEAEMIIHGKSKGNHSHKLLPQKTIKTILKELHQLGPDTVVVTDGPRGSYALSDNHFYHMPIKQGPLIERTGAGDSYASGFLSAVIHGKTCQEAMMWGTINSWSVVQHIGPIDGLMYEAQMKKLVKSMRPKPVMM
ncbi:carbohydrate kinase family protein [Candidatus Falkowbacteria bacterium]|nr:carbohydrate kinase family protein [Candidatus Falkowbacteria bacterium]